MESATILKLINTKKILQHKHQIVINILEKKNRHTERLMDYPVSRSMESARRVLIDQSNFNTFVFRTLFFEVTKIIRENVSNDSDLHSKTCFTVLFTDKPSLNRGRSPNIDSAQTKKHRQYSCCLSPNLQCKYTLRCRIEGKMGLFLPKLTLFLLRIFFNR